MKRKIILLALVLGILLTGCGWMDGSYVHVTPHENSAVQPDLEEGTASSYPQLRVLLEEMLEKGRAGGVIYVTDYNQTALHTSMSVMKRYILNTFPLGAYALEDLTYEIGSTSGKPAVAVEFYYRHSPTEIRQIRKMETMERAETAIGTALENRDSEIVLLIEQYDPRDFGQLAEDYAMDHPDMVMETPHVNQSVYGNGDSRVLELQFEYETSRAALGRMQERVKPVFEAAKLYVSENASDFQKYSQLYSFLMERYEYRIETSITPTYSLLHHGVGDSRAFAVTYGAMCRQLGLDCRVVIGTREGEPRTWNMVRDGNNFYHVDLLACHDAGVYRQRLDSEMVGYVWDYSDYPTCNGGAPAEIPLPTEDWE